MVDSTLHLLFKSLDLIWKWCYKLNTLLFSHLCHPYMCIPRMKLSFIMASSKKNARSLEKLNRYVINPKNPELKIRWLKLICIDLKQPLIPVNKNETSDLLLRHYNGHHCFIALTFDVYEDRHPMETLPDTLYHFPWLFSH